MARIVNEMIRNRTRCGTAAQLSIPMRAIRAPSAVEIEVCKSRPRQRPFVLLAPYVRPHNKHVKRCGILRRFGGIGFQEPVEPCKLHGTSPRPGVWPEIDRGESGHEAMAPRTYPRFDGYTARPQLRKGVEIAFGIVVEPAPHR